MSDFSQERAMLEKTWAYGKGLFGWLSETDHKKIGMRYIVTAFLFFAAGGIEAALMRIQLMKAENHFLTPDQYNQIFTMHGTTMMFLFAVPVERKAVQRGVRLVQSAPVVEERLHDLALFVKELPFFPYLVRDEREQGHHSFVHFLLLGNRATKNQLVADGS